MFYSGTHRTALRPTLKAKCTQRTSPVRPARFPRRVHRYLFPLRMYKWTSCTAYEASCLWVLPVGPFYFFRWM